MRVRTLSWGGHRSGIFIECLAKRLLGKRLKGSRERKKSRCGVWRNPTPSLTRRAVTSTTQIGRHDPSKLERRCDDMATDDGGRQRNIRITRFRDPISLKICIASFPNVLENPFGRGKVMTHERCRQEEDHGSERDFHE